MDERAKPGRVLQMRLVVEAPDYEEAVAFYRDVLGASEELVVQGDGVAMIDDVEVGRRVSPRLRVAFEVSDASRLTSDLLDGGAELIAGPTVTPWQSLNSRLSAPADLQITLFEELGNETGSTFQP